MKKYFKIYLVIALLASVIYSCSSVPITGRRQLDIIPDNEMLSMSFQQYDEFLKSNKESTNKKETEMVQKVGAKIAAAVQKYFNENNLSDQLNGYKWEFHLIESKEANAWCMPGGKVVVYTGILPITKSEAGLAVVMGHEIAHAIAKHGNERMSQGLLTQLGGIALSKAIENKPAETQNIFMAIAGYNPNEALDFWQRMLAANAGQEPPEFLSSHPSNQTRIDEIKKELPEALKYFNASK